MKEGTLCPVFTVEGGGPEEVYSPRILLGRGPACHLRFQHEKVSVVHAEVVLTDKGYLLRDLFSTNGVYVNEKKIQQILLKPGDWFRLGREGPSILFQLEPSRSGYRPRPVERTVPLHEKRVFLFGLLLLLFLVGVVSPRILQHRRQARALRSVFLLGRVRGEGVEPLGSAFLLNREGWLLTDAHVASALQESRNSSVALPNTAPEKRCAVLDILIHPDYHEGEFRWDVAFVRIDFQAAPSSVVQWSRKQPSQGQSIFCVGYPRDAVHPSRPTASLLKGVVSRVEGEAFFQHDVLVTPGLSGSPLFDEGFGCIGIVLGGDGSVGWALTANRLRSSFLAEGGVPRWLEGVHLSSPFGEDHKEDSNGNRDFKRD